MNVPPVRVSRKDVAFSAAAPAPEGIMKNAQPRSSTGVLNNLFSNNNNNNNGNSMRSNGGGGGGGRTSERLTASSVFGFISGGLSSSTGSQVTPRGTPRASLNYPQHTPVDSLDGDTWDKLHRKSFLNTSDGQFGGAPLIGPNSNRRRSSKRQSMMKRNVLAMEESFMPAWWGCTS
jgi:hypothetical protein